MQKDRDFIQTAKVLGYNNLAILDGEKIDSEISISSLYIQNSTKDLKDKRKKYDLIASSPSSVKEARIISKKIEVDILIFREFIDKLTLENIVKNEMFFAFDLGEIIFKNGAERIRALKNFEKFKKFIKKYPNNVIFTTMPKDKYMLRSPRDLVTFLKFIGIEAKIAQLGLAYNPLSTIKRGREFRSGKIIDIGVKIADDSS